MLHREKKMVSIDDFLFISLPKELQDKIPSITIDPEILLPIEATSENIKERLKQLSIEVVIASMLKIFLLEPPYPHLEYYKKIIFQYRPDIIEHLIDGAIRKEKEQDYDTAEQLFKIVTKLEPNNYAHLWNLAIFCDYRYTLYKKIENNQMATYYEDLTKKYLDTLFTFKDVDVEYHYKASLFYLDSNNYDLAIKHLSFYIEKGSDKKIIEESKKLLQQVHIQKEKQEQLQELYSLIKEDKEAVVLKAKDMLNKDKDFWEAAFFLGWSLRQEGKYQEAQKAFEQAITINDSLPHLFNELAICHLEQGNTKECRKLLKRGLLLDENNISILSNLALLELKEDKQEKAKQLFEKILTIDPQDPIALKFFKKM